MSLPGFSHIVFLSHVNEPGMPVFPGDPDFELRSAASQPDDGFYLQEIRIGEQSGTHWAAPAHYTPGEAHAEDLTAEELIRPISVIDVRDSASADPDYELALGDVANFEATHGTIAGGSVVVMWTGFGARWGDPKAYLNADAQGVMHYPGYGVDAARWLIAERRIAGLGIDSMGVDPGRDEAFVVNHMLMKDRRIHVENMTGLDQMPASGGWLVIGGLRNSHGSGGPATLFGLIP
jgi:kynurenine formamidase